MPSFSNALGWSRMNMKMNLFNKENYSEILQNKGHCTFIYSFVSSISTVDNRLYLTIRSFFSKTSIFITHLQLYYVYRHISLIMLYIYIFIYLRNMVFHSEVHQWWAHCSHQGTNRISEDSELFISFQLIVGVLLFGKWLIDTNTKECANFSKQLTGET